jgi:hypothetical protein
VSQTHPLSVKGGSYAYIYIYIYITLYIYIYSVLLKLISVWAEGRLMEHNFVLALCKPCGNSSCGGFVGKSWGAFVENWYLVGTHYVCALFPPYLHDLQSQKRIEVHKYFFQFDLSHANIFRRLILNTHRFSKGCFEELKYFSKSALRYTSFGAMEIYIVSKKICNALCMFYLA